MKKTFALGFVLAMMVAIGMPAIAEDATTITGEPVDIACYLGGKSGEGHAACAKSCAEKGQPIGIAVTGADGKVSLYLAMGSGGKAAKDLLAAHMGHQVKATGVVAEKGGLKVITIASVEMAK